MMSNNTKELKDGFVISIMRKEPKSTKIVQMEEYTWFAKTNLN